MSKLKQYRSDVQSGFTLIETLIALFVVSLLSAMGASLLFTTLSAGKQVTAHTEILRDIEISYAFVRDDFSAMTERSTLPPSGYEDAEGFYGDAGGAEGVLVRFTRSGWTNPDNLVARSDLQRIEYRLENGNLIRTAWLRPDATQSTPKIERVLATGLERVDLRYARNGEWSDRWRASVLEPGRNLPDVVEMIWTFSAENSLRILLPAGGRVS